MKRRSGRVVLGMLLGTLAVSCQRPAPPSPNNLVVTGSSTLAPLVQEMGKRFEKEHPGVRVSVQAVGSARGVSDVQQGLSDIGMVAGVLRPGQAPLHSFLLARDGVCLVVPSSNPVAALTDAQVVAVFTRTTANWKQLGGADAPITVVGLADGRSLAQAFLDFYNLKPAQVRADVVAGDGEQILQAVANKPYAIGYAAVGPATEAASRLSLRLLPIGGVPATPATVADGSYRCLRPLLLVTRGEPKGLVKEFIDYARSPAARDLLDKIPETSSGD